jgi:hypothetical protein
MDGSALQQWRFAASSDRAQMAAAALLDSSASAAAVWEAMEADARQLKQLDRELVTTRFEQAQALQVGARPALGPSGSRAQSPYVLLASSLRKVGIIFPHICSSCVRAPTQVLEQEVTYDAHAGAAAGGPQDLAQQGARADGLLLELQGFLSLHGYARAACPLCCCPARHSGRTSGRAVTRCCVAPARPAWPRRELARALRADAGDIGGGSHGGQVSGPCVHAGLAAAVLALLTCPPSSWRRG